jgi:hypothetical protein
MVAVERRCQRCGRKLSRYNTEDYCFACAKGANRHEPPTRKPVLRDPVDPVKRLQLWLNTPEFAYVLKQYRKRRGIPAAGPEGLSPDKRWAPPVARAAWEILYWLDGRAECWQQIVDALHGAPLPEDFAQRCARPYLPLPRYLRADEAARSALEEELGLDVVSWADRPRMHRRDLPLILLVEDSPRQGWKDRMQMWNFLFPHDRFNNPESLAKAWKRACGYRDATNQA